MVMSERTIKLVPVMPDLTGGESLHPIVPGVVLRVTPLAKKGQVIDINVGSVAIKVRDLALLDLCDIPQAETHATLSSAPVRSTQSESSMRSKADVLKRRSGTFDLNSSPRASAQSYVRRPKCCVAIRAEEERDRQAEGSRPTPPEALSTEYTQLEHPNTEPL